MSRPETCAATVHRGVLARFLLVVCGWLIGLAFLAPVAHALPSAPSSDATVQQMLQDALAAYDRGADLLPRDPQAARRAFTESANLLQVLVDSGINDGRVWYDLGNARLQAGELGAAIHAYLEAERRIPADPRVQANLAHARSLRKDRITPAATTSAMDLASVPRRVLSPGARLGVALTAWIAAWVLLGVRLLRPAAAPIPVIGTCLLVALLLGATVAIDVLTLRGGRTAVLVRDGVVVRKGNGEGFEPAIEQRLSQGVELDIEERRGEWLRIRLPDGKEGWIREDTVAVVGDMPGRATRAS